MKSILKKIPYWLLVRWGVICALFLLARYSRTPILYKIGSWDLYILAGAGLAFIMTGASMILYCLKNDKSIGEWPILIILAISIFFYGMAKEVSFHYKKHMVLNTPVSRLSRLGRHVIVGYNDPDDLSELIARRAIAGIYITKRNVKGKNIEAVQKEVKRFQDLAGTAGYGPLFVAADQEGGQVSRLSPPLDQYLTLSEIVGEKESNDEDENEDENEKFERKIEKYAMTKARDLSDLGINVNLSPVVDLKTDTVSHIFNLHTRIDKRAISSNIFVTARAAMIYCSVLESSGIASTLKHFPGLGSVKEDTHFNAGVLDADIERLEEKDWYPFKSIAYETSAFIMLGHVILSRVDPITPVSFSEKVIQEVIRDKWLHEGILITDDLNMGPAFAAEGGIGNTAVKALNAGVDLLLISYDGTQYFPAMYDLVMADKKDLLDLKRTAQSHIRLINAQKKFISSTRRPQ